MAVMKAVKAGDAVDEAQRYRVSSVFSFLHSLIESSRLHTFKRQGAWRLPGGGQVSFRKGNATVMFLEVP